MDQLLTIDLADVHLTLGKDHLFNKTSLRITSDGGGNVIALLGPSGVGKTTLLRLIAGLVSPSAGQLTVKPSEALVGYVPHEPILYPGSPRDNCEYFRRIRRLRQHYSEDVVDELITRLKLDRLMTRRSCQGISRGELQRLSIVRALSVRPQVLLLDEPCTGMDISSRYELLAFIKRLATEDNKLILYVTHHLDEVSFIADQVLFVDRGSDGTSSAKLYTFEELDKAPPNPSSLDLTSNIPWNDIPYSYEERTITLLGHRGTAEPVHPDRDLPVGKGRLLLHPETFVNAGSMRFETWSTSHSYAFGRICGDVDQAEVIVPRELACVSQCGISGKAYAFSFEAESGCALNVEIK